MSLVRFLAVGLLAATPIVVLAADAPHEDGGGLCQNCHLGHNAPSGSLTKGTGNFNLCESCHDGHAPRFEFPWVVGDQAVPGTSGRSHNWSAAAENATLGTTVPSSSSTDVNEAEMGKHLDAGKLECSTCHNQHQADALPVTARGTQRVSPVTKRAGAGTGAVTVDSVAPSAAAKAYLIDIVAAGVRSAATFRVSYDNGKSWFGCATGTHTYVVYAETPGNACSLGAGIPLDNVTSVTASFAGDPSTYASDDEFTFYVSYPFLRADVTDAKMCTICHRDRNMSVANLAGTDGTHEGTRQPIALGTTKFHHPVGPDAIPAQALEPDGDSTSDGITRNNLVLGAGGGVTCLTCHRVHNAYSNSLTPDPLP
jgi:predicted CXXCH cytochrome family protein